MQEGFAPLLFVDALVTSERAQALARARDITIADLDARDVAGRPAVGAAQISRSASRCVSVRCTAGCQRFFPLSSITLAFACTSYRSNPGGEYEEVSVIHTLCHLCDRWYGEVTACPCCPDTFLTCPACGQAHGRPCPFDCACRGLICGGFGCTDEGTTTPRARDRLA